MAEHRKRCPISVYFPKANLQRIARRKRNRSEREPVRLNILINFFHFQVFRHGPRTPADTYPTDPHINETFYPYGWGHITNV